jgi:hypothetical protein
MVSVSSLTSFLHIIQFYHHHLMFSFAASISDSLILLVSNVYCIRTPTELEMYGFGYLHIFRNYIIQIRRL